MGEMGERGGTIEMAVLSLGSAMNILLVYPEFPPTFWSYAHALKFIGKRAVSPPLGLLTVAALLPASFAVRLVDLNVSRLTERDLGWADYVFLSAMVVQEPSARAVIGRCREAGVPVVAGGPLFTSQAGNFGEVDHLVLNEAEITLPLFLEDLAAGRAKRVYRAETFADIRKTPVPRFELADLRRYAVMPVQYSRGCPFDCEFCDVTALFGHRPRVKEASQMVAELDRLRELGWKGSVFFVDDNLVGNPRQLKTALLPELVAWQARSGPMPFNTQASINLADDEELLEMMPRAGFSTVFIGIETPDPVTLLSCNKRQNTRRDMLEDVRKIQTAGMQVQGGFIVGFDHDDPSIFQKQIEFIQSSGIVTAMVGLLQALPGTRLHARLRVQNRLREGPASSEGGSGGAGGNNVAGTSNILPVMDAEVLREGYFRVMRTLYSPGGYYVRVRTFLRRYGAPKVHGRPQVQYLRAFLKSLWVLGVLGRERVQYWYTLWWTLLHRPRLFPMAVHLAILGRHYRRICERFLPARG